MSTLTPIAAPGAAPLADPGTWRRLSRVIDRTDGRLVIIPFDHGMSKGPITGIEDPRAAAVAATEGGADAIMCHAGLARFVYPVLGDDLGVIVKLTDGATDGTDQVLLGSVEQAARVGADAVCVEFFLGADAELETIQTASRIRRESELVGLPLLVAAYVHPTRQEEMGPDGLVRACRLAAELGADLVKTKHPGSGEDCRRLVEGCHVPVVVAGGARSEDEAALFATVDEALVAGAAGVAVGRNAWGAPDPADVVRRLVQRVHGDRPAR